MKLKNKKTFKLDPFGESEPILTKEEIFDDKGNLIEIINYFQRGGVEGRQTYLYNEDSKVIEEKLENSEGHTTSITYKYNAEGERVEVSFFNAGEVYQKQTYTKSGDQKIQSLLDYEGNELEKVIETYENELLTAQEFYENGALTEKHNYTYDEKGVLKSKVASELGQRGDISVSYKHDSNGRKIEEVRKENDQIVYQVDTDYSTSQKEILKHTINGSVTYQIHTLDSDGKILERVYENEDREMLTRLKVKRDAHGNVEEESYYNVSGSREFGESYSNRYELEYA